MASAMFVVVIFIFSIHTAFSKPIDLAAEYSKVDDEVKEINDTSMQVNALKHMLVAERQDHQRTKDERKKAKEEAEEQRERAVKAELDKKGESDVLWLVRVRSAVEFFQSEHGSDAQYSSQDWTNLKALKNRHERSCLFRELNFKWIFANKQHVHAVADLTNRIQNNPFLGTTDKFSKLIATATSDLSVSIHNYLLTPGKGQYDVEFSTRYAETNEAVKEFWRTFAFAENIVKKVTPTFTTVSTEPSTP